MPEEGWRSGWLALIELWHALMHSSSEGKLFLLPWQPPYQNRLHLPTTATKYQRVVQLVQGPWALGSRHMTRYATKKSGTEGDVRVTKHKDPGASSHHLDDLSDDPVGKGQVGK